MKNLFWRLRKNYEIPSRYPTDTVHYIALDKYIYIYVKKTHLVIKKMTKDKLTSKRIRGALKTVRDTLLEKDKMRLTSLKTRYPRGFNEGLRFGNIF